VDQNKQTSNTRRIPKRIWAPVVTISIVVIGYLILPTLWFWIAWEVVAALLVAVGCFGEWHLFKREAAPNGEQSHRAWELRFILMVAIGVTMELGALPKTIVEALRLQKQIAELEEKQGPRRILSIQRERFIRTSARFPKSAVRFTCIAEPEAELFAGQLARLAQNAGYDVELRTGLVVMPAPFGIEVRVYEDSPASMRGFMDALTAAEIQFRTNRMGSAGLKDLIYVVVGRKPEL
jgi:hypothetical protein